MGRVRCPYCRGASGRSATTPSGRCVTECCSCGRVVEERQLHAHHLFPLRALDNPLPLVTPDLPPQPPSTAADGDDDDDDPFHPTGFITAFSTWSIEPSPLFARSASSFAGHLAELERALDSSSSSSSSSSSVSDASGGPLVSVDHLRAYLQILEVSSILRLDHDIADHAFQLFRDCSSATCLRNRSIEALATAALVQAIREAQEPRTLQEISTASNLPQKEIGKYIKILGEALKLSQPINSNSISVHMPRFCTLLQLNKSAQELAAHIGEVVVNKCFCTRRNPISISAAAIYLACQLEDKRKTQAEICKVTGLTEVTLRKVYKELLENWDDLLPPNYTPAVPPEKAFPMTIITSGRSSTNKVDMVDLYHLNTHHDKDKHAEAIKSNKASDSLECTVTVKEEADRKGNTHARSLMASDSRDLNQGAFCQPQVQYGMTQCKMEIEKDRKADQGIINLNETESSLSEHEKINKDLNISDTSRWMDQTPAPTSSKGYTGLWQLNPPPVIPVSYAQFAKRPIGHHFASGSRENAKGASDDGDRQCHKEDNH
ncbi:plant-specific TFIIB-related protein 1 isoform X1 [Canna indica]|uniref:Plant-specific TFIIB-related protein 1 isoform X1 n=1 Tax=Canna indica TaxID=4628 RepID=A0AAQ3QS73_9LILI|nr:plant-specific TFIIB-related protein 1 isoform X1 [Canna indica]